LCSCWILDGVVNVHWKEIHTCIDFERFCDYIYFHKCEVISSLPFCKMSHAWGLIWVLETCMFSSNVAGMNAMISYVIYWTSFSMTQRIMCACNDPQCWNFIAYHFILKWPSSWCGDNINCYMNFLIFLWKIIVCYRGNYIWQVVSKHLLGPYVDFVKNI